MKCSFCRKGSDIEYNYCSRCGIRYWGKYLETYRENEDGETTSRLVPKGCLLVLNERNLKGRWY